MDGEGVARWSVGSRATGRNGAPVREAGGRLVAPALRAGGPVAGAGAPRRQLAGVVGGPRRGGRGRCSGPGSWGRRAVGASMATVSGRWSRGGRVGASGGGVATTGPKGVRESPVVGSPEAGCSARLPPRTEEKPRSREAPGLRARGRRSSRRSPSRQVVFGQPAVQVTKRPMFSAPNALAGGVPSPVRSSSPSASQVQVKLTSIVWVQSFVS